VGRHSAVEDDEEDGDLLDLLGSERPGAQDRVEDVAAPVSSAPETGRHARTDDTVPTAVDGAGPGIAEDATAPVPAVPTGDGSSATASEPAAPRPRGGTRADARLLRTSPALLARCIAAVVTPFVLYALVLLVIGRLDDVSNDLVWLWIPAVAAGVLVGAFLDAAHRRERRAT
jgi:hypothetical protein